MSRFRLIGYVLALLAAWPSLADYEILQFKTGSAVKQSALVDGDALHVFSSNLDDSRHYQRFDLGNPEKSTEEEALPESLIFVDEIKSVSGTRIALVLRDEVRVVGEDQPLLKFQSIYNAPVFQTIPQMNAFRDLNGDGLDDFLIPTFDGYQVAVQLSDGTFAPTSSLAAIPLMDMSYNSHPWYQASNIFNVDLTNDGRRDLAFWQPSEFRVYPQLEDGSFSSEARLIPTRVPLDYDSVDGMSLRFSNEDQSNKTVNVIHSLADYNGDGTTDLMAMRVKSEGVLNKTTTFSLYPGLKSAGDIEFSLEPIAVVQSNGIQYEMAARDLDGDGDLDLMVSSVELGLGKIIGALLTSSIKVDLGFYPFKDGTYDQKAATTRNMTVSFSLSSGEYFMPAVALVDQNQDGRLDLLIQDSDVTLNLYAGENSDRLFANRAENIRVAVPKDPDLIRRIDADGDGALDLLMQIPPPLGETAGHRVVLLLSR